MPLKLKLSHESPESTSKTASKPLAVIKAKKQVEPVEQKSTAKPPKEEKSSRVTKIKPGELFTIDRFIESEGYKARHAVVKGDLIYADRPRMPSGIFAVDYIMGGGIPLFGTTTVYGPEQGGKTSFVMQCLAQLKHFCFGCFRHAGNCICKNKSPRLMKGFVVAAESDFDSSWATSIGADKETYYVGYPEYFEDASRMTTLAMEADDCGFVAIDSVAAVDSILSKEDLEGQDVAVLGKQMSRFCKKVHTALIKLLRRKDKPLFLMLITQARANMDGNKGFKKSFGPDFKPYGAWAFKHMNSYLLQATRASFDDKEKESYKSGNETELAKATKHRISIEKYKFPTLARKAAYIREIADLGGFQRGAIPQSKLIARYARDIGLAKAASNDLIAKVGNDPNFSADLQRRIIELAKKSILPQS